jgi:CRP-like cAMP-binding protein
VECNHCGGEKSLCLDIVPIFSSLSHKEKQEVMSITTSKTFEKNEMIYMAGESEGNLYVLHAGRVKISRLSPNGKEQVIRVAGPGEFIGELSLLRSSPQTDNGQATETTTMCIIEGEKLKELMKKYPSIALKVMETLSERLEKAENLIEKINNGTVEQRLAYSLLEIAGSGNEVFLNMTKGDFASRIGMSQETLSRKLALFQESGLIRLRGHRKIIIKDRKGLQEITSMPD